MDRTEPTIQDQVSQIQKDIQELNQTQFVGGDSWLFYRVTTGQTEDIGFTLTAGKSTAWRIRFIPATTDLAASDIRILQPSVGWNGGFSFLPVVGEDNAWDIVWSVTTGSLTIANATVLILSTQGGTIQIERLS